jgi:hypothetical protein
MELLDSDDPVKSKLLRQSAHHREQLEEDVKLISEKTEKIITNALIIGGALAATYFIVSQFSSSKKRKSKVKKIRIVKDENSTDGQVVVENEEPETPGVFSQIGSALASQATVLLLAFAKEKLGEYMQSQTPKKENTNDNP